MVNSIEEFTDPDILMRESCLLDAVFLIFVEEAFPLSLSGVFVSPMPDDLTIEDQSFNCYLLIIVVYDFFLTPARLR